MWARLGQGYEAISARQGLDASGGYGLGSKAIMIREFLPDVWGDLVARKNRLLVIECVPREDLYLGELLSKFLKETDVKELAYGVITNKSDLIEVLGTREFMRGYGHVHIVTHGTDGTEEPAIIMSRGIVYPEDFPVACFKGIFVTWAACGLSRKSFMEPFTQQTRPAGVIAPLKDVEFADAALFFLSYYYLVFRHHMTPFGAFDRVKNMLCYGPKKGRVKGDWIFWTP